MSSPQSLPTAPALPPELPIRPIGKPIDLDIAVPGSKSITNRYLIISALADGQVTLTGMLHSDDPMFLCDGLTKLGFDVRPDWSKQTCAIRGLGGEIPSK